MTGAADGLGIESMTEVQVAGDSDIPGVVATLAEAFATDPVLSFLFEDPARRPSLLAAFFANRLAGGRGFDEGSFQPTPLMVGAALRYGCHQPNPVDPGPTSPPWVRPTWPCWARSGRSSVWPHWRR